MMHPVTTSSVMDMLAILLSFVLIFKHFTLKYGLFIPYQLFVC